MYALPNACNKRAYSREATRRRQRHDDSSFSALLPFQLVGDCHRRRITVVVVVIDAAPAELDFRASWRRQMAVIKYFKACTKWRFRSIPAAMIRIAKDIAAMFKYWSARSSEPVSSSSFAASAQRGQVILNHGHAGTFARLDCSSRLASSPILFGLLLSLLLLFFFENRLFRLGKITVTGTRNKLQMSSLVYLQHVAPSSFLSLLNAAANALMVLCEETPSLLLLLLYLLL